MGRHEFKSSPNCMQDPISKQTNKQKPVKANRFYDFCKLNLWQLFFKSCFKGSLGPQEL